MLIVLIMVISQIFQNTFKNKFVLFDVGLNKYTSSVAGTARSNLLGKNWTITDGGGV